MPSPDGMIIFLCIGGLITILGSCFDWVWYWTWGGRVLEDALGHNNLQKVHFAIGIIFFAIAIALWSNAYLSASVFVAGLLGIIFACLFGLTIYRVSNADFSATQQSKKIV